MRLAGDDEPVPMGQRPELLRIFDQPDAAATLRAYIAVGRLMYSRAGKLLGALLTDGPGADTDLKAFVNTIETERRIGNTSIVDHLERRFGLPPPISRTQAWTSGGLPPRSSWPTGSCAAAAGVWTCTNSGWAT